MDLAVELQHLSADQIEELYQHYLAGEKNSILIERYRIKIAPNSLIKILPPLELQSLTCPYCKINMYENRKSKSSSTHLAPPAFCKTCPHKHYYNTGSRAKQRCGCAPCIAFRNDEERKLEARKIEKIQKVFSLNDRKPILYELLNIGDKMNLLAVLEAQTNERFDIVFSMEETPRNIRLTPTKRMDSKILKSLYDRQILLIDPKSPTRAFSFEPKPAADIDQVRWILNVSFDGVERPAIAAIYSALYDELRGGSVTEWKSELLGNMAILASEEVLQFVHLRCNELGLPFGAEDKTREITAQLLKDFSVREICYFADLASRRAHNYAAEQHVGKMRASNTIPNKMLHTGEKALRENWSINFKRKMKEPRSEYSKILHNLVLKLDDFGDNRKISEYVSQACGTKTHCTSNIEHGTLFCPSCGSSTIHVMMDDSGIVINCKDCISRSALSLRSE